MTDRELLELIARQVGGLSAKVDGLEKEQKSLVEGQKSLVEGQKSLVEGQKYLTARMEKLEEGQKTLTDDVKKTNLIIENDIKPKIDALFDGYKQNAEKLDRIETKVVKHEEFIIKRIK
jgi:chromosome segregation ATPase